MTTQDIINALDPDIVVCPACKKGWDINSEPFYINLISEEKQCFDCESRRAKIVRR